MSVGPAGGALGSIYSPAVVVNFLCVLKMLLREFTEMFGVVKASVVGERTLR